MNTKNNRRRLASRERIESVFMELLQTRTLPEITVADLCKRTGLNRSTFYANYTDIYGLADTIRDMLEGEVNALYENDLYKNCGSDYLKLFYHIRDNQIFYKTYFKLGYDGSHAVDLGLLKEKHSDFPSSQLAYHVEFHRAGLNAVILRWLDSGCRESPEEMVKIIKDEYTNRHWGGEAHG